MEEDEEQDVERIKGDSEQIIERTGTPENLVDIYSMVLNPQSKSSKRFSPIIEEKEIIDPKTKEKKIIKVVVGYAPYTVPFREKHTIDETSSYLSKRDKDLVRIDRQLCTYFQILTLDYGIDMGVAYDFFFENSTDELNLSKSVEQRAIAGLRTTRTYQEGKAETKHQQVMEHEKKNWGFLRK